MLKHRLKVLITGIVATAVLVAAVATGFLHEGYAISAVIATAVLSGTTK